MSTIDQQIKDLLLKKAKINYLSYIADLIKNDTKCSDFKDVQKEVVDLIEPFLLQLMNSIETGTPVNTQKTEGLSESDISILKTLATKVVSRKPQETQNAQPFEKSVPKNEMSHTDKLNFAMNYRHLANKRVQVMNDQNAAIYGSVVGLDAPYVLIKTETGPTIQVPVEKVVPT